MSKEPGRLAFEALYKDADGMDPETLEHYWQIEKHQHIRVEAAIRADERERCAKIAEPKAPRPCDCDRCYCQNYDDAQAVAAWDADNHIAAAIRAGEKPANPSQSPETTKPAAS